MLDLLLHLLRRRELVGDGRFEEGVLYTAGCQPNRTPNQPIRQISMAHQLAGCRRTLAPWPLFRGGACLCCTGASPWSLRMRSSTRTRRSCRRAGQATVPTLIPDGRLQGAPRPWILRDEVLRAALLEVDHQEARARVGAL